MTTRDPKPTAEQVALARAIVSEMARKAGGTKSPARAAASRRNAANARAAKAARRVGTASDRPCPDCGQRPVGLTRRDRCAACRATARKIAREAQS
jgi:hypothetical protein